MGHSEHCSQSFCSLPRLYVIIILQNHFFPVLDHFLHCSGDLSMEYFEAHSFTVSTIRVKVSLVFLILAWFC